MESIKQKPINKAILAGCLLFDLGCIFLLKIHLNINL